MVFLRGGPPAAICDLCRALFSLRVSRDFTDYRYRHYRSLQCSLALCYGRNSKAPPKRSVELTTRDIRIPLPLFLILFAPRLPYRSRPSNFHPSRDPASPPKDFRSHLRYPIFRRESSLIFVLSLSFANRDFYGLHV